MDSLLLEKFHAENVDPPWSKLCDPGYSSLIYHSKVHALRCVPLKRHESSWEPHVEESPPNMAAAPAWSRWDIRDHMGLWTHSTSAKNQIEGHSLATDHLC